MKAIGLSKQIGYDGCHYLGKYKGSKIYEPYYEGNKEHYVGIVQFIKETKGKLQVTKADESFEILDAFYGDK